MEEKGFNPPVQERDINILLNEYNSLLNTLASLSIQLNDMAGRVKPYPEQKEQNESVVKSESGVINVMEMNNRTLRNIVNDIGERLEYLNGII